MSERGDRVNLQMGGRNFSRLSLGYKLQDATPSNSALGLRRDVRLLGSVGNETNLFGNSRKATAFSPTGGAREGAVIRMIRTPDGRANVGDKSAPLADGGW